MTTIDPRAKQSDGAQLALQQVFTELDVLSYQKWVELSGQIGSEGLIDQEKLDREPVLAAISRETHLVLLGQPGSGKSTLVNFISLCLAAEQLGRREVNATALGNQGSTLPSLLPVRIILRDYAARGLSQGQDLWTFITAELGRLEGGGLSVYADHLQEHLQHQGGLLLLDGLDEVPDAHRRREQLRQAVVEFRADFPQVRIVVTSRPYAYTNPDWQLPDFARADLLDFSPDQIASYIDRWYAATGEKDPDLDATRAGQYAAQLKREVESNPNLGELAPRPLLLALMVSLHRWRGGGALPQEREKLYDQSVDLLLDLWQRPKQLYDEQGKAERKETSGLVELGIASADLRNALSKVAFEAHRDQPAVEGAAEIPGRELAAALYDSPGRKEGIVIDRIIRYAEERAGLLEDRGVDSKGRRVHAFPHRTFQEYLAACHLLALGTFPDELATLAREDTERWREAVLLAAGRAKATSAALVWDLVEALCPRELKADQDETSEEDWRGALLAGGVLVETELSAETESHPLARRHKEKLRWVLQSLSVLLREGVLSGADRAAAGVNLGILGDPRPEVVSVDEIQFCLVPGGSFYMGEDEEEHLNEHLSKDFWISRYPITNAQFTAFIDGGGYGESRYWREAEEVGFWSGDGFKDRLDPHHPRDRPIDFGRPYNVANHPVVGVTWYETLAYTRWLTDEWDELGVTVALPSEAEWEKAARGGLQIPVEHVIGVVETVGTEASGELRDNPDAKRLYPWGNEFDLNHANTKESGVGATSAVGCFPAGANPYGVQDIAGNVWEWTRSLYEAYPYEPTDGREALAAVTKKTTVILRGGAYYALRKSARCAYRFRYYPHRRNYRFGFRVVLSPLSSDL